VSTYKVFLDEENQIVYQQIFADQSVDDFNAMIDDTIVCSQKLRDPDNTLTLIDFKKFGKPSTQLRKRSMAELKNPRLKKVAVIGGGIIARVMIKFTSIASGLGKIRWFQSEEKARAWLIEK
jgi:hypothetical protein